MEEDDGMPNCGENPADLWFSADQSDDADGECESLDQANCDHQRYTWYGTREQLIMLCFAIFQEVSAFFQGKINRETNRKVVIYSAHDDNVQAFLNVFGLTSYECIKN